MKNILGQQHYVFLLRSSVCVDNKQSVGATLCGALHGADPDAVSRRRAMLAGLSLMFTPMIRSNQLEVLASTLTSLITDSTNCLLFSSLQIDA